MIKMSLVITGLVGLFVAALLFTSLPVQILTFVLRAQSHEAQGFSLQSSGFFHRTFKIERFSIHDEIRDLEIEDLELEWNHQRVTNLHIGKAYFRDKTKPNISLRKLVMDLNSSPDTAPTCIEKLQIDHISVALSFSSKAFSLGPIDAKNICISGPELQFETLTMASQDLIQAEQNIALVVTHDHFYDVPQNENLILRFPRNDRFIGIIAQNSSELLSRLTAFSR